MLLIRRCEAALEMAAEELGGRVSYCVADIFRLTGSYAIASAAMRAGTLDGILVSGPSSTHGSALDLEKRSGLRPSRLS